MELKKGEKIVQEGDVRCLPGANFYLGNTNIFMNHGILHLTNQRLLVEYYEQGMPIVSVITGQKKKEVEIPLTSIRKVEGSFAGFAISYEGGGKLQYFQFRPESFLAMMGFDDWIKQIRRTANVPHTESATKDLAKLLLKLLFAFGIISFVAIGTILIIISIFSLIVFILLRLYT